MAKITYIFAVLAVIAFGKIGNAQNLPTNPWSFPEKKQTANVEASQTMPVFGPQYPSAPSDEMIPTDSHVGTNPWKDHKPRTLVPHEQPRELEQPYEKPIMANIPNTVQYVPKIQRGGAAQISRPKAPPAPEPSFWDDLLEENVEDNTPPPPPAADDNNTATADGFAFWFGEDNALPDSSVNNSLDNLAEKYNEATDKYNTAKRVITKSIHDARRTLDDLNRNAQQFLP